MFETKIKNKFLFVFVTMFFILIVSMNFVNANSDINETTVNDLKFITKEAKLNQNKQIQVQLFNSQNQTLENKIVNFYVYNKKSKKYKYIGKSITDTTGIATLKYKFKSYGKINVKTSVVGDNFEKSAIIFVPKTYFRIKNTYSKIPDGGILYSTIVNNGSNKANFKIYYKFSKDTYFPNGPVKYKYNKPKVVTKESKISKIVFSRKEKYLYLSGTIKKKGKIKIQWRFKTPTDDISIKPVVKSKSTKILGNNPLKFRIIIRETEFTG